MRMSIDPLPRPDVPSSPSSTSSFDSSLAPGDGMPGMGLSHEHHHHRHHGHHHHHHHHHHHSHADDPIPFLDASALFGPPASPDGSPSGSPRHAHSPPRQPPPFMRSHAQRHAMRRSPVIPLAQAGRPRAVDGGSPLGLNVGLLRFALYDARRRLLEGQLQAEDVADLSRFNSRGVDKRNVRLLVSKRGRQVVTVGLTQPHRHIIPGSRPMMGLPAVGFGERVAAEIACISNTPWPGEALNRMGLGFELVADKRFVMELQALVQVLRACDYGIVRFRRVLVRDASFTAVLQLEGKPIVSDMGIELRLYRVHFVNAADAVRLAQSVPGRVARRAKALRVLRKDECTACIRNRSHAGALRHLCEVGLSEADALDGALRRMWRPPDRRINALTGEECFAALMSPSPHLVALPGWATIDNADLVDGNSLDFPGLDLNLCAREVIVSATWSHIITPDMLRQVLAKWSPRAYEAVFADAVEVAISKRLPEKAVILAPLCNPNWLTHDRKHTLLSLACGLSSRGVITPLLDVPGTDVNLCGVARKTPLHMLLQGTAFVKINELTPLVRRMRLRGAYVDLPDSRGVTALHLAAATGRPAVLKAALAVPRRRRDANSNTQFATLQPPRKRLFRSRRLQAVEEARAAQHEQQQQQQQRQRAEAVAAGLSRHVPAPLPSAPTTAWDGGSFGRRDPFDVRDILVGGMCTHDYLLRTPVDMVVRMLVSPRMRQASTELLRMLLATSPSYRPTARNVHAALTHGGVAASLILLRAGASPNECNLVMSPLRVALRREHFTVAKQLIANGAVTPEFMYAHQLVKGMSEFHEACLDGNIEGVRVLLAAHEDVDARAAFVTEPMLDGTTAIHLAAASDSVPVLEAVLDCARSRRERVRWLSLRNSKGLVPFQFTAAYAPPAVRTARYLLAKGPVGSEHLGVSEGNGGHSVLTHAIFVMGAAAASYARTRLPSPCECGHVHAPPSLVAEQARAARCLVAYLRLVIKAGAPVNVKTSFGETALTLAVHINSLDAVRVLLEAGADTKLRSERHLPYDMARSAEMQALLNPEGTRSRMAADEGEHLQGIGPSSAHGDQIRDSCAVM